MKLTHFDALEDNSDVIIVLATIENKYGFEMAFDTAATHTTLDSNMLYMSGYKLKNAVGEIEIETSNGIITVNLYNIRNFECLGIRKDILQVQVYDFAAHGIVSEYAGVLGLNFLKDHRFCVDMIKGEITIN
jgi:Aspartyl protease